MDSTQQQLDERIATLVKTHAGLRQAHARMAQQMMAVAGGIEELQRLKRELADADSAKPDDPPAEGAEAPSATSPEQEQPQ